MPVNAEEITSQLIKEHGLHEAYQVALNNAAEAIELDNNYLLSVMREVKATLRSRIDKYNNAVECEVSLSSNTLDKN